MSDGQPLTTGWETDLAVDDTVLRQFVYAYAQRVVAIAEAVGGTVERTPGAVIGDARSPFFFDNAVVLIRPPGSTMFAAHGATTGSLDGDIARAGEVFGDRPWVLLSVWPTPDLSPLGLTLVGHPPLMLRLPGTGGTRPEHPPHLMIHQVDSEERLADFTRVLAEGYPLPDGVGVAFHPSLVGERVELFVGYVDGQPVACGGAALGQGLVEIDYVATLPEHRRRGYGTALTWAAATMHPDLPATLLASDDGASIYRRMGFVPLLRCTMWMRQR